MAALRAGLALPFLGGPAAFALARLHAPEQSPVVVRAAAIGPAWDAALARVTARAPTAALPPGPLIMGVLNATPDSFSDGGRHLEAEYGTEAGLRMIAQGAAILDIGGESTRPGAVAPSVGEECRRVLGLVEPLAGRGAVVSVDTRRAAVMRAALDHGAAMINDVSGLADPDAIGLLAERDCTVAIMHMRGTPATMQAHAQYDDVAVDVVRALASRVEAAVQGGIARSRIVIDPGIGFAKTGAHNIALLQRLPILANLGCRVLLGVSRKSFIGHLAQVDDPRERGPGTLAALAASASFPDVIHRVHDVADLAQYLAVQLALGGQRA